MAAAESATRRSTAKTAPTKKAAVDGDPAVKSASAKRTSSRSTKSAAKSAPKSGSPKNAATPANSTPKTVDGSQADRKSVV